METAKIMDVRAKQVKTTKDFEIIEVENTPFSLVKHENEFTICVANYKVSQKVFKSRKAAEEYINSKPYELLFNGIGAFVQLLNKQHANEN